MLDKEDYSKIIEESLIRKGYLPKPTFEEKLQDIITNSFQNFEWKKKEHYAWEDKDIKDWEEEDFIEYEKCQPDYITGLPGDLRTNDLDVLEERAEVLDERMADTKKEISDLNKELNSVERGIDSEHDYLVDEISRRGWSKETRSTDEYTDDLSSELQQKYDSLVADMDRYLDEIDAHYNDGKDITPFVTNLADKYYSFEKDLLAYYGKSDWRIPMSSPLVHWQPFFFEKNQFDGIISAVAHSTQLQGDRKNLNVQLNRKEKELTDYENDYDRTSAKIDNILLG